MDETIQSTTLVTNDDSATQVTDSQEIESSLISAETQQEHAVESLTQGDSSETVSRRIGCLGSSLEQRPQKDDNTLEKPHQGKAEGFRNRRPGKGGEQQPTAFDVQALKQRVPRKRSSSESGSEKEEKSQMVIPSKEARSSSSSFDSSSSSSCSDEGKTEEMSSWDMAVTERGSDLRKTPIPITKQNVYNPVTERISPDSEEKMTPQNTDDLINPSTSIAHSSQIKPLDLSLPPGILDHVLGCYETSDILPREHEDITTFLGSGDLSQHACYPSITQDIPEVELAMYGASDAVSTPNEELSRYFPQPGEPTQSQECDESNYVPPTISTPFPSTFVHSSQFAHTEMTLTAIGRNQMTCLAKAYPGTVVANPDTEQQEQRGWEKSAVLGQPDQHQWIPAATSVQSYIRPPQYPYQPNIDQYSEENDPTVRDDQSAYIAHRDPNLTRSQAYSAYDGYPALVNDPFYPGPSYNAGEYESQWQGCGELHQPCMNQQAVASGNFTSYGRETWTTIEDQQQPATSHQHPPSEKPAKQSRVALCRICCLGRSECENGKHTKEDCKTRRQKLLKELDLRKIKGCPFKKGGDSGGSCSVGNANEVSHTLTHLICNNFRVNRGTGDKVCKEVFDDIKELVEHIKRTHAVLKKVNGKVICGVRVGENSKACGKEFELAKDSTTTDMLLLENPKVIDHVFSHWSLYFCTKEQVGNIENSNDADNDVPNKGNRKQTRTYKKNAKSSQEAAGTSSDEANKGIIGHKLCDKVFLSRAHLNSHVRKAHETDKMLSCPTLGIKANNLHNTRACCGFEATNMSKLHMHMKRNHKHEWELMMTCSFCKTDSQSKPALKSSVSGLNAHLYTCKGLISNKNKKDRKEEHYNKRDAEIRQHYDNINQAVKCNEFCWLCAIIEKHKSNR